MPWDVATRWNSTYDMMSFALQYRSSIDDLTANKSLRLRNWELDDVEWQIVKDLASVLEVCFFFLLEHQCVLIHYLAIQKGHSLLLS